MDKKWGPYGYLLDRLGFYGKPSWAYWWPFPNITEEFQSDTLLVPLSLIARHYPRLHAFSNRLSAWKADPHRSSVSVGLEQQVGTPLDYENNAYLFAVVEPYPDLLPKDSRLARDLLLFLHLVHASVALALAQPEPKLRPSILFEEDSLFNVELTAFLAQGLAYHTLGAREKQILRDAAGILALGSDPSFVPITAVLEFLDQFDERSIMVEENRSRMVEFLGCYPDLDAEDYDAKQVKDYMTVLEVLMSPEIENPPGSLVTRLIAVDFSELMKVLQDITSLTDPGAKRTFWSEVANTVERGQVPAWDYERAWDKLANLWPEELRFRVISMFDNPRQKVRDFAARLLLRLDPAQLCTIEELIRMFGPLTDPVVRGEVCEWLHGQDIEQLYNIALSYLEDATKNVYWSFGCKDIVKPLIDGRGATPALRAEAARIAYERLRRERANTVLCKDLLRLLLEVGTVEQVADALRGDGNWLDTGVATAFFHWDHAPDQLIAALRLVWHDCPVYWRRQLEEAWSEIRWGRLVHELRYTTERGVPYPYPFPFVDRFAFSPPWLDRAERGQSLGRTEIDPESLQPLPRFFGMPLAGRITTIKVDRLRFEFLLNQAVVRSGQRPARDWLREQRFFTEDGAEMVLRDEQICDTQEARLADAIARAQERFRSGEAEEGDSALSATDWAALEEARYSIWGGLLDEEGEWRWTPDRFETLSPQAFHILSALRDDLQEALTPAYRRAQRNLRRRSVEWTQRISELPAGEFPLHFPTLPWEGVLGEYGWKAQQILLYRPMIDWVARDLARETRLSPNTTASWLGALVMAHEATHAVIHLGMDAAGRWWQNPGKASLAFHESLAQWMARAWLAREIDADGRKVMAAVERRLPAVYHLDAVLPDVLQPGALEAVRYWLLGRDENLVLPDILDVARRVLACAIKATDNVGPPTPEIARELDALATRTPPDLVDIKKMIDLLTRWAWPEIVASDPELLALLATPHQLACAAFVSACQALQSAGDTLRILTVADMQKYADALVFRHREAELNDLVVELRHLRELQRLAQAGQRVTSASLAVPEVSRQ